MNDRIKGRKKENEACDELEALGFKCVMPNAKFRFQKDTGRVGYVDFFGLWDIIAINDTEVRLIQVKSKKGKLYGKRKIPFIEFQCPKNCSKEMWVYTPRKKGFEITKF